MEIRIGTFNEIPLYLNIPTPLQLYRQFTKGGVIASIALKPMFYDQLKAKYEGSISYIPQKDLPHHNPNFIAWTLSWYKIVVQPKFLLLPQTSKLFVLWHEYGHYATSLITSIKDDAFHDVYEAITNFYACCKLKLHFNAYIKIIQFSLLDRVGLKRRADNNAHLLYEERFQKLYMSRQLPIEERGENDHVYEFYRDKDKLIDWYTFCFKEICKMDYQHFFCWDDFLAEIGWDNDEDRWKYIDYKKQV